MSPTTAPDRPEIVRRLSEIFADVLARPALILTESDTPATVPGWDSLAHITVMLAVEHTFGFKLRTAEIAKLQQVGELVTTIMARGKF